jgi:hypothetical protein
MTTRRGIPRAHAHTPDIVEEMLSMDYEESVVFQNSSRWIEFLATYRLTSTSWEFFEGTGRHIMRDWMFPSLRACVKRSIEKFSICVRAAW